MDERTERLREVSRRAADAVRGLSILDQYAVLRMVGSAVRSHGISDRGLSPDAFQEIDLTIDVEAAKQVIYPPGGRPTC